MVINVQIKKNEEDSWEKAFDKNINAINVAIDKCSSQYTSALISTKSILIGMKETISKGGKLTLWS